MSPPPALTLNQLVDVEGVIGKLADGRPAVLYPVVYGYLDANGNLAPRPHVVKPPDKPVDWPWKVDMTAVSAAKAEAPIMNGGSFQLLTGSGDTIDSAKQQTNPVTLSGKVVTAGTNQFAGCVYIEETDRSSGIKVETGGTFVPGDLVNVTGTVAVAGGECCISSATVTRPETPPYTAAVPAPIFMIHRNLGGEAFGEQPAVKGGVGLSNVGLLVKAVGKVTAVGSAYFYIDDGSALNDGLGVAAGVRVETDHAARRERCAKPSATWAAVSNHLLPSQGTMPILA